MPKAHLHYLYTRRETDISETLLSAYEETHYCVFHEPPFALQIGVRSEEAAQLHQDHEVHSSVFLTACNPFSQPLSEQENRCRQVELERTIARQGWVAKRGIGRHPTNDWPAEPSFLILGISIDQAMALGRRFDQNALVFLNGLATSELVLLV